jgi:two-component system OmpR family sensor kinase
VARHFLGLYLLIVLTLAAVSWGQDKLLQMYSSQDAAEDRTLGIALAALQNQLRGLPADEWKRVIEATAAKSGVQMELFATADIVGRETLDKLKGGGVAFMQAAAGQSWALQQLDEGHVLAIKTTETETQRGLLEWGLTVLFYAAMALVIMIWIWPLTRDLRALEKAAAQFGNKNWRFDADIKPRSQIYPLAKTFRRMAARIDGLIASHKDMSNAVSHEIKTPLARMQFEIELAQQATSPAQVQKSLGNIKTDIAAINDLVTATLNYAILERADMSLHIGAHDFTALVPAIAEYVRCDARPDIRLCTDIQGDAVSVKCDMHLLESVLRNLLYNAARFAKQDIRVTFNVRGGINQLIVDDDGPGIPVQDRQRVFESFVQLDDPHAKKVGFGLGLAIVKRAMEWHGGQVSISQSPYGGARVCAEWPEALGGVPAT